MRSILVAAAAAVVVPASLSACPNWQAAPNFGQISLNAGFLPDPYVRNITAGGTHHLRNCGFNLTGYVTSRPDFDLYWDGFSSRLTIAVEASADSILLVNDPNGEWHFSDDVYGNDPVLVFYDPLQGLYDIWVGTYDGSRRNPGLLVITEYDY